MAKNNKRYMLVETTVLLSIFLISIVYVITNLNDILALAIGTLVFLCLFIGIKIFFLVIIMNNNSMIIKEEELLDRITDIVPGGCINFLLDEELTITYINKKFLEFTGYTKSEIKEVFVNKYLYMIDTNERDKVIDVLHQSEDESKSQIYYRQLCKDGDKKGVISMFHIFKNKKGEKKVHCLLIDPSKLKQVKLEKDVDAERYRIVAEQSESIIFDINILEQSIYLNSHFKEKFGYDVDKDFMKANLQHKLIHPDDLERFVQLGRFEDDYSEIEVRIKKIDGNYLWCKLRVSTIYDDNKTPIRLVGKVIDVDKSRREKSMLIEKTKIDIMSGFYNKVATENIINDEISQQKDNILAALLVIDIDNFKQINDKFGHIKGDEVLTHICNNIKPLFRSSDILGRVGGDEFVVFLKDLHSEEHAIKKAKDILESLENISLLGDEDASVSVSIGIAYYDKDGKDYKELFDKADKALYKAKNNGKKTFEIC